MQVRGSSVDSKRSFLEKKGLTPDEIAEAFKRVPETPSASTPAAATGMGMCRLFGQIACGGRWVSYGILSSLVADPSLKVSSMAAA